MWGEQAIETLKTYYPHFGKRVAIFILSENVSEEEAEEKAKELGLERLDKEDRLCTICLDQKQAHHKTVCVDCHNRSQVKEISFRKWTSLLIADIKWRCGKKDIAFDLDIDYLIDQWLEQDGKCFYSKLPMTRGGTNENGSIHRDYYRGTIDRIDPTRGYVKENTVWCTWACNVGKGLMGIDEYLSFCRAVSENHDLY